ncbi:class III extradiol dioxygenase family protein [Marinomonas primoryensis]|jgi:protocatechuate 4,5-dioxygenase beta chain|uniref:Class III extradiol dioxygenase family protein n=1 Tax=Marinomonas primoryensis TaxID=178399 RepID=A0A859CXG7_9GAMM|nr:class III extradiol dioxygenase family protein [Marinomonas primoryensis]QKK79190.1 class III extradiol dioxygenase subunit B [Marinomonas primoryensis]|tara:strand:- start:1919 stop:2773 length:855 start_codon:yes stop_codon:yes gene_type:complete
MAKIIGAVTTSHIPAIANAMANGLEETPYWKPFFDGYPPVRDWLNEKKPDVIILFYNDHGLEFFIDKKPTFAIGVADEYYNSDEGWGIPTIPPVTGESDLSWHIANSIVDEGFDMTICQEMKVDHGLTVPLNLMWPGHQYGHVKVIPVCINCEQYPMAQPWRTFELGRAIGRAVASYEEDINVVVFGTGGMSHQLDGERAGFINRAFDIDCLDKLVSDPEALTKYSNMDLVEQGGAQAVELNMLIAMRGTLLGKVTERHRNYHAPISNTGSGLMLLENEISTAE